MVALVVWGWVVFWLVTLVGNGCLVRVGWLVVGFVLFGECVLCFSSQNADKELTFLFSPLFLPIPSAWFHVGFLQDVITEFIARGRFLAGGFVTIY